MNRLSITAAKARFYSLLREVEGGQTFTITRRGKAVAFLRPVEDRGLLEVPAAIEGLRDFRRAHRLGGLSLRDVISDGRRR